jgi:hypothetical protein
LAFTRAQDNVRLFRDSAEACGPLTLPGVPDALALRKRIFVPTWWCEGHLFRQGQKERHLQGYLERKAKGFIILPAALPAKRVGLIFALWNELVGLSLQSRSESDSIRLPLEKFLKGTAAEVTATLKFLSEYWAQPFEVLMPTVRGAELSKAASRKSKSTPKSLKLSVHVITSCSLEQSAKPALHFELALPLRDLVMGRLESLLPRSLAEDFYGSKGNWAEPLGAQGLPLIPQGCVSVNPDILRAFSTGVSQKKLLAYLFVELTKNPRTEVGLEPVGAWRAVGFQPRELKGYHEAMLGRTKSLYDHGIFGWECAPPQVRVRDLLQSDAVLVHGWRLSSQSHQAQQLEEALNGMGLEGERSLEAAPPPMSAPKPLSLPTAPSVVSAKASKTRKAPTKIPTKIPSEIPAVSFQVNSFSGDMAFPQFKSPSDPLTPAPVPPVESPAAKPFPTKAGSLSDASVPFTAQEIGCVQLWECVRAYFLGLNARQQRLFITQKSRMSHEEFRAYLKPLFSQNEE